ncbi:hypothetical protein ACTHPH_05700 [Paenibacillus pasadenensis]|uniref:Uncharacterized protein n=1 Tax=Paenibacillus pasadenensis TaxID=217090 RepID=A0A2N5ND09_9BACL|nr:MULTISPECIES: hypothetical protein [Paenibacillus]PLT48213.1 hypothetical protein B8V81_0345 [Paenibacillus pasadenensis]QGG58275.1 hypothetical protein GE073_23655 [Paenibacillus sp. B01]
MSKPNEEKDKAIREQEEPEGGREVPAEIVEQQDDPEPEGGKASGQPGLGG